MNHNENVRPLPPPYPPESRIPVVNRDAETLVLYQVLPGKYQAFTERLDHNGDMITAVAPWLSPDNWLLCARMVSTWPPVNV